MRRGRICLALFGLLAATGCIYMNVVQPLDTDLSRTKLGTKVGRSEAQSVLGLVAWGDAGTQAAARNGGIKTLNHADTQIFSILGFVYTRQTTIVYGD
jgi:TRL (tRNA-associated locus)-like protein